MTDEPLYRKYKRKLQANANQLAIDLAHGQCDTYSDYKEMCGIVKGLNKAIVVLDELIEEYKLDD